MATTPQQIPLNIAIAPFPEGFQGDMDETFQQACQLMAATIAGNFLTGLVLPPGSTLPSTDQGPIAIGNVWYFWDPATGQYLPQTVSSKAAKNFVKNSVYQIQQTGATFTSLGAGVTKTYDMVLSRSTPLANVLAIDSPVGPAATADNDYCQNAIRYTVGPALVSTPGASDIYAHEHLIEGADIAMIQGEVLSLSFSVWTNTPGTYSYYLTSTGRDCSFVGNFTITTPNVWSRIKVPSIPAIPTVGTWNFGEGSTGMYIGIPMYVGTQWQSAAGNLNKWQPAFMAGSASNINLCTVVGNKLVISGIKLEASPQVSYLSVPSFEQDFWECIRYYFTTLSYQSATGTAMDLRAPTNGVRSGAMLFPRRMAKVPTVVPIGYVSHASGQITNMSAGQADIPVATLTATQKGVIDFQNAVISTSGTLSLIALTGTLVLNSSAVTGLSSTASLSVGMSVLGSGIAPGTFIDTIVSGTAITLSKVATTGGSSALSFGTFSITGIPSTTGMAAGQPISANAGIPAGTTIASIASGTAITISAPVTAAGTATLTIALCSKGDVLWALINADARLT